MSTSLLKPPKRLGEFLLSTGRISSEQLIEALIEQAAKRQTELSVIRHLVGLPAETCLQLVDDAAEAERDLFHQVVVSDAAPGWDLPRLTESQERSRPAIGKILVQLGYATQAQMRSWLFEFMGQSEPAQVSRFDRPAISIPQPAADSTAVDTSISDVHPSEDIPANEHHAELPTTAPLEIESAIFDDYREFLNDDLRAQLDSKILSIHDLHGDALAAELDGLYRDLHSIKGSANFLGASATVATVHLMEDCLGLAKRQIELLDDITRQELIDSFLVGLDLVWELRAGILSEHDEGPRLHLMADRHLAFQHALLSTGGRLAGQAASSTAPLADLF